MKKQMLGSDASLCVRLLEYCVQFSFPPPIKDIDKLEAAQNKEAWKGEGEGLAE